MAKWWRACPSVIILLGAIVEFLQNIQCLRGQKKFAAPSAPRNCPDLPKFSIYFAILRNDFSKKNTKKFSKPYIPKFLHFIAFLSNNFSEISLKFSKTVPSAPFSGALRPKNLQNFSKRALFEKGQLCKIVTLACPLRPLYVHPGTDMRGGNGHSKRAIGVAKSSFTTPKISARRTKNIFLWRRRHQKVILRRFSQPNCFDHVRLCVHPCLSIFCATQKGQK